METYVRNGLLERARNEEEFANRAIDNNLPSLAAFHQEKAKELRTAAGEEVSIWKGIEPMPDTVADPGHLMGRKAFWIVLTVSLVVVTLTAIAIYLQVNQ
jgi:hypothetical protein